MPIRNNQHIRRSLARCGDYLMGQAAAGGAAVALGEADYGQL